MDHDSTARLRADLVDRRTRIARAMRSTADQDLARLLRDVDAALERIEAGRYGTCEVCETAIDTQDLLARPLLPWCLCELSPAQQSELQRDFALAARIQRAWLPAPDLAGAGWTTHYRYLPAGPVSGDYCDAVAAPAATPPHLDFFVGDVMGHGVAAALLMARLHALFRTLVDAAPGVAELMARMNRLFQDRASESHFVTAICGRARAGGAIQLCNAGHCAPVVVRRSGVEVLDLPPGMPVGLQTAAAFAVHDVALAPGEMLVLYTDGLLEARADDGGLFGPERLLAALTRLRGKPQAELVAGCVQEVLQFAGRRPLADDLTLLTLARAD